MFITELLPYDYINFKRTALSLCEQYRFLNPSVIGRSCAGRDIMALKIGKASEYALITAAFHGTEYLTTTVLMRFIEELCKAIASDESIEGLNARRAMFGRGVIFVPLVNPDGCEIAIKGAAGCGFAYEYISRACSGNYKSWNANLRGVDINHNFSAGWSRLKALEEQAGICGPSPRRFGGFKCESEPETIALCELCRRSRIRHIVALHSQGEVIYWQYGDKKIPRAEKMAEIMATSSGYELSSPEGLAVGGGFKDWFIEEFSRPGFTVEIGKGKNPLPESDAPDILDRIREMLMLTVIM